MSGPPSVSRSDAGPRCLWERRIGDEFGYGKPMAVLTAMQDSRRQAMSCGEFVARGRQRDTIP